jgi:hypothetical protein
MNSNSPSQACENSLTSERKALFSAGKQALWRISVDEFGLGNWIRPYIGSGLLGIRYGGLIAASWNEPPLKMYSKFIFDDARQLELPTWLHLGTCDDHFTTVWGIKNVLRAALASMDILRQNPDEDWSKVEAGLCLPPADGEGIFPEYSGYAGAGIKQADLILSFYPLGYRAPEEVTLKNVEYYSRKIMGYGPVMNSQIESCILMRNGRKKEGIEHLFHTFREFVRGPHFIPFECRNNDNSFMLTGIAGTLQALIYGYYGATVEDSSCIPKIGDCWAAQSDF